MKPLLQEREMKERHLRARPSVWRAGKRLTLRNCLVLLVTVFLMLPISIRSSPANVVVRPGDNIQALVESHPPGTNFDITPGIYRLQSIRPKDGDTFSGEPGADLTGAQVLNGFTQQGRYWVANVSVSAQASYRGVCDQEHPACMFPEDVFVDDAPLQRVARLSDVTTGKWYLDYNAGEAYLGSNPAGHKVEISLVPYAFHGSAKNVTIENLTIEKYANVAGDGAVEGKSEGNAMSDGWVVRNNVIKLNHGMGIRLGNQMQVLNNKVMNNGQMGLGGSGANILVAGNEIAYNNYAGYKYGWEAGGTKFTFTRGLVVRDNFVHDNNGPGLWTDIENHDTLYEHNRTTANKEAGILHEISYHAIIRDNTIENDGYAAPGQTSPWFGGGIVITASQDVEVYGNTVTDCMNGIIGLQPYRKRQAGGGYFLRNLYVHNNIVTQKAGIAAGILKSSPLDDSVFTSWNNRFIDNTFHLGSQNGKYFEWMDAAQTLNAWLGLSGRGPASSN